MTLSVFRGDADASEEARVHQETRQISHLFRDDQASHPGNPFGHLEDLDGVVIDEDDAVCADVQLADDRLDVLGLRLPVDPPRGDVVGSEHHGVVTLEDVEHVGLVVLAHHGEHDSLRGESPELTLELLERPAWKRVPQLEPTHAIFADHPTPEGVVAVDHDALGRRRPAPGYLVGELAAQQPPELAPIRLPIHRPFRGVEDPVLTGMTLERVEVEKLDCRPAPQSIEPHGHDPSVQRTHADRCRRVEQIDAPTRRVRWCRRDDGDRRRRVELSDELRKLSDAATDRVAGVVIAGVVRPELTIEDVLDPPHHDQELEPVPERRRWVEAHLVELVVLREPDVGGGETGVEQGRTELSLERLRRERRRNADHDVWMHVGVTRVPLPQPAQLIFSRRRRLVLRLRHGQIPVTPFALKTLRASPIVRIFMMSRVVSATSKVSSMITTRLIAAKLSHSSSVSGELSSSSTSVLTPSPCANSSRSGSAMVVEPGFLYGSRTKIAEVIHEL